MFAAIQWSQLWHSNIEMIAVITGVICVALITITGKYNIGPIKIDYVWNWPIGIVSSAAFVYVFWDAKLYLNALLQVFYVVTGFLGWYWWIYGGENRTNLPISRFRHPENWALVLGATAGATVAMWMVEANVVHSASPFWDAVVVCLSLTAQFVMTRKYIEHWFFWIAVDVVGTVLFFSQHLALTGLLYIVYGSLCVRGLFTWRKARRIDAMLPIGDNPVIHASVLDPWADWDGGSNALVAKPRRNPNRVRS